MCTLLGSDDPRAKHAIDLFVYRIGRELGSLAAALGSLDAIVFTAGIDEKARRFASESVWMPVGLVLRWMPTPTRRMAHAFPLPGAIIQRRRCAASAAFAS